MNNLNKLKEVDMLPLSNDYVFKRIFGKGGNERILKSLLEAILKINIQKIEIKNPEIPKESIEEKFKTKKPKVADLLEKWLYVIGGDQKMMEEYKKENEEIKEAVEQLKEMSADEYERELYEIRERSRLTYNTEMYEARRKGLEEGEARGEAKGKAKGKTEGKLEEKKEIAKKMKEEGFDIKTIQNITGLTEEEIERL